MSPSDLVRRLSNGVARVFEHDAELFELGSKGINEQTLTFRLGLYLAREFPEHHVDCEYNRHWDRTKSCQRFRIKWMKPDVIVHRRRCDEANMICIEAKKAIYWRYVNKVPSDVRRKLRALTHPSADYGYALGLAWRIASSSNPNDHEATWFIAGHERMRTPLGNFEQHLLAKLRELRLRDFRGGISAPSIGVDE
jgi:hypothetical protein